jgi:hypothetical protein
MRPALAALGLLCRARPSGIRVESLLCFQPFPSDKLLDRFHVRMWHREGQLSETAIFLTWPGYCLYLPGPFAAFGMGAEIMKSGTVWGGTVLLLCCVFAAPMAAEPRADALNDPVRPGDAGPMVGGISPKALGTDTGNLVPRNVYQELVAPPSGADIREEPAGIPSLLGDQPAGSTLGGDSRQDVIGRRIVSDPAPLEQVDMATSSVLVPLLWLVPVVLLLCAARWAWSWRSERTRARQSSEPGISSRLISPDTDSPRRRRHRPDRKPDRPVRQFGK